MGDIFLCPFLLPFKVGTLHNQGISMLELWREVRWHTTEDWTGSLAIFCILWKIEQKALPYSAHHGRLNRKPCHIPNTMEDRTGSFAMFRIPWKTEQEALSISHQQQQLKTALPQKKWHFYSVHARCCITLLESSKTSSVIANCSGSRKNPKSVSQVFPQTRQGGSPSSN